MIIIQANFLDGAFPSYNYAGILVPGALSGVKIMKYKKLGGIRGIVVCMLIVFIGVAGAQDREWGVNREIVQVSESVYRWGSDNQYGAYIVYWRNSVTTAVMIDGWIKTSSQCGSIYIGIGSPTSESRKMKSSPAVKMSASAGPATRTIPCSKEYDFRGVDQKFERRNDGWFPRVWPAS